MVQADALIVGASIHLLGSRGNDGAKVVDDINWLRDQHENMIWTSGPHVEIEKVTSAQRKYFRPAHDGTSTVVDQMVRSALGLVKGGANCLNRHSLDAIKRTIMTPPGLGFCRNRSSTPPAQCLDMGSAWICITSPLDALGRTALPTE